MIDRDKLRADILARYKITIGEEDPVLISAMLFEGILEQVSANLHAGAAQALEEVRGQAHGATDDAVKKAQGAIQAAVNASRKVLEEDREARIEASESWLKERQEEIQKSLNRADKIARSALVASWFAAAGAGVAFLAVVYALISVRGG